MAAAHPDVLVVGAGLAGLSAALAAREAGAEVMVLERAPREERGGNTRFSNGAMRAVYGGVDDIARLVGDLGEAERRRADFGSYSREQYYDDLGRVTQYRCDQAMADLLVERSADTMEWLAQRGVRFLPLYEWQFKLPDGRVRFSGGSALECAGGGEGLSASLFRAAEARGVEIRYGARAVALIEGESGVMGVVVREGRRAAEQRARAVALACGGFEANTEWRTRYLGPSWELAKVRGSRFNTGDGLRIALDRGAMSCGHWSGCHSASWDLHAPDVNELALGTVHKRDDYMYGVLVNSDGERFVDEGADIRALTYAKLGRVILAQPGQVAWQIFDAKGAPFLHGEYRARRSARFTANALEDLADQLQGLDRVKFLETIAAYNASLDGAAPFDSGRKDGRRTRGLAIPKSNWAQTIDTPPFEAFAVTCGVTFTFGGLKIDGAANVLDVDGAAIPGLYAAGELVGGLFYFNYPGGSGLMAAAVFGRIAGESAASQAAARTLNR